MIPAQAVEAAVKGFTTCAQDQAAPSSGDVFRECITAALEAAAPYMLEAGKGKGPIVVPVPRSAVTNLYRTRT